MMHQERRLWYTIITCVTLYISHNINALLSTRSSFQLEKAGVELMSVANLQKVNIMILGSHKVFIYIPSTIRVV